MRPESAWAVAWSKPNPQEFIIEHSVRATRAEAWDWMLGVWYSKVTTQGAELLAYLPSEAFASGRVDRSMELTREAAVKRLRRKGVRVIRVKVVPYA